MIARIVPPIPVDTFVAVLETLHKFIPEGTPESSVVISGDGDGASCVHVAADVDVPWYFANGHLEIRWVAR